MRTSFLTLAAAALLVAAGAVAGEKGTPTEAKALLDKAVAMSFSVSESSSTSNTFTPASICVAYARVLSVDTGSRVFTFESRSGSVIVNVAP